MINLFYFYFVSRTYRCQVHEDEPVWSRPELYNSTWTVDKFIAYCFLFVASSQTKINNETIICFQIDEVLSLK